MSKDDVSTPSGEEVNTSQETAKDDSAVETTVDTKEETIADAMKDDKSKVPDSIPYSRFQEKVNSEKELKARVEELEAMVRDKDMSDTEVSDEIADIADEHNIDPKVLEKLAKSMNAKLEKTVEERLAPLTERDKREKQDKILTSMLDRALEARPEFKDVIDVDVVKQLALLPQNANKTLTQLMEQTYGKAIKPSDKKTMETTTPGKSEAIESIDYSRAKTDTEYFKQIKADPKLHAEYNKKMTEDLSRYM